MTVGSSVGGMSVITYTACRLDADASEREEEKRKETLSFLTAEEKLEESVRQLEAGRAKVVQIRDDLRADIDSLRGEITRLNELRQQMVWELGGEDSSSSSSSTTTSD